MKYTYEELRELDLCPRCWSKTEKVGDEHKCFVCHTTITEDKKGRNVYGRTNLRMLSDRKGKFVPKR